MRLPHLLLAFAFLLALPATAAAEPYATPGNTGLLPPLNPNPGPSISGSAQVGGTLAGSRGSWGFGVAVSSRWMRCNVGASTCTATGDTDLSYTVTSADIGLVIKLRVVGSRLGSTNTEDAQTATIPAPPPVGQVLAPANATRPEIQGTPRAGELLTLTRGTWTGTDPISYSYAWASCNATSCRSVSSGATYRVTEQDVGRRLLAGVVARNAAGSSVAQAGTDTVLGRATGLKRLSPFPTLLVDGRVAGRITRITTLRLRRVPGGATIRAACTGRGCPFRKTSVKVRKGKSRTVAVPKLQRRMRAGTTVVITVRKGNTLGKYIRLRFRRGSAPARVDRCVVPKSSKPVKCP